MCCSTSFVVASTMLHSECIFAFDGGGGGGGGCVSVQMQCTG